MRFFLFLSAYLCVVSGVQASGLTFSETEFAVSIGKFTETQIGDEKLSVFGARQHRVKVVFQNDGLVESIHFTPDPGKNEVAALEEHLRKKLPDLIEEGKEKQTDDFGESETEAWRMYSIYRIPAKGLDVVEDVVTKVSHSNLSILPLQEQNQEDLEESMADSASSSEEDGPDSDGELKQRDARCRVGQA